MDFWIVAGLAAFLLGVSKGGLAVVAALAVPLMALFMDPAKAAGLLLPLYIVADVYAVYLFRKAFSLENLKVLLPSASIGVLAGYFTVAHVSGNAVKLLLCLVGFSYLASSLRNRLSKGDVSPTKASTPKGIFWGALAGLTSYIAHSGGPPFQAYVLPQRLEKMVYLGTATIFFATVNLMKLPFFILADQVNWASVSQSVWLAPLAIVGAWTGARITRWMSERIFFILIEVALALVSFRLLYEVLFG